MQTAYEHLLNLPFPRLSAYVHEVGPLDLSARHDSDPWSALIRVVVGQQVSTHAAAAIWNKVQAACQGNFEQAFLDAPETLEGTGLSRAKVRTLTELLQAKRDGTLDLEHLAGLDFAGRHAALTPYWGIGPWSVEMWSMFHCDDGDIWSAGDLALRKGAAGFAEERDPDELINAARPWRTYLALYCWHAANANLF